MKETTLHFAGLRIGVRYRYLLPERSPEFFAPPGAPYDFEVALTDEDLAREKEFSRREAELEGRSFSGALSSLEFSALHRRVARTLPRYNGIVFHASAVAVGDEAFVFTAKSGVGKTTHTRLWLKNVPGSFVVDGDKPVIRATEKGIFVCGTPWNGKEKLGTNRSVKLRAICHLCRGEENRIEKISLREATPFLIEQTYRSPDPAELAQTLRLIKAVGEGVSLYRLTCNMKKEAALLSFGEMTK